MPEHTELLSGTSKQSEVSGVFEYVSGLYSTRNTAHIGWSIQGGGIQTDTSRYSIGHLRKQPEIEVKELAICIGCTPDKGVC